MRGIHLSFVLSVMASLFTGPAAAQYRHRMEGASAGQRVTLIDAGAILGSGTVGEDGWAEFPGVALTPGAHQLRTQVWGHPAAGGAQTMSQPNGGVGAIARRLEYRSSLGAGRAVAAVDLNDDGSLDLAIAAQGGLSVRFAEPGSNPRQFGPETGVLVGQAVTAIAAADFDGDGTVELAAATEAGSLVILHGLARHAETALGFAARHLLVTDLNGDAIPDVAASGARQVAMYEGAGDGSFRELTRAVFAAEAGALAAADFDRDGHVDIAVALPASHTVAMVRRSGEVAAEINVDAAAAALGVFEANGAAHLLVRAAGPARAARLWRNLSDGFRFDGGQEAPGLTVNDPTATDVDLNADLAMDRVELTSAGVSVGTRSFVNGVTKTHSDPWNAGDTNKTWTITVSGAVGGTEFQDILPAGVTFVDATGSGWEIGQDDANPQLIFGQAFGTNIGPITITVDVSTTATGSLTNTVTVDGVQATDTVVLGTGGGGGGGGGSTNGPDARIVKSHLGNFARGQVGAVYTLSVANVGNQASTGGVTVTEVPPAGLTVTGMSGSGWTCDLPNLRCSHATAAVPGFTYPDITVTINVAADAPSGVINSASVAMAGDINGNNNSAGDSTSILAPDLTIVKTHTGNFRQNQTDASFTITVTNSGTVATIGAVTVGESINTGLLLTGLAGTGWSCNVSTFSCTRSDVLAGGASYPPVTATFTVRPDAPAQVSNTATVSGGGDASNGNNTSVDTATVDPVFADLTITKTRASGTFERGSQVTYTLQVNNTGANQTSGTITVTEIPPATGLTINSLSGAGWGCSSTTRTCTGNAVILAGGAAAPITVFATVSPSAPESLVNQASVSGGGESNTANNNASDTVSVPGADLSITKAHTGDFYRGQTGAIYRLTVNATGTADVGNGPVTVTEQPPAGLTVTAMSGSGWACTLGTLTCTSTQTSGWAQILVTVDVAANAPASLTNVAVVSGGGDRSSGNNTASDPTTVSAIDLSLAKTHTGNFTRGQANAQYTLTVTNSGPIEAPAGFTVTEEAPTGLTLVSMSGAGWSCPNGSATCTATNPLARNASTTITVTVNVAGNAPTSLTNTATLNQPNDGNPANNTASDPTTILAPDLALAKTHTGSFYRGQANAAYTLTVTNTGTAAATGVTTVTEAPPAGLTVTAISGSGWNCTLGTLTCTTSAEAAAGAGLPPINVTATVAIDAALSLTNSATVSHANDTNAANNTALDPTTITAPDFAIVKTHTGNFFRGQVGAIYSVTVSNAGTVPGAGTVTVTEAPPAGMTITAMTGPGWNCAAPVCTYSGAEVAVGASLPPINVTVSIAADAALSLTNTATLSNAGDNNTANNTASDVTTVEGPDLTITKTHTGIFSQGQTGATYTLTVTNAGPRVSVGSITVTEAPPAGLTVTAMSGTNWTCNVGSLSCTTTDVRNGGTSFTPITVTVNVAADAAASLTNSASVSGGGDTNAANNAASDPTTIASTPTDLAIAKTHTGNFTRGQTNAQYTITVTNVGTTSTGSGDTITVTELPPAGLTVTAMSGAGWTCSVGTLTCISTSALASGASRTLQVTTTIGDTLPGSFSNQATVSFTGDANSSNNTASDVTTIGVPDLTLSKSNTGFIPGASNVNWAITVANSGTSPTVGAITVTELPPAEFTITSMSLSRVGAGTCNAATRTCTITASMPPGDTIRVSVIGNIAPDSPASIVNRATISGGADGNTSNNSVEDTAAVLRQDLTVSITPAGVFAPNTDAQFLITVTNVGNQAATAGGLTLTNLTPSQFQFLAVQQSLFGSCTNPVLQPGVPINCTSIGSLAPGASGTITLSGRVFATGASVTLQAVVTEPTSFNQSNNTATSTVPLPARLTHSVTTNSSLFQQNATVTMLLNAVNTGGASGAANLAVTGLTGASVSSLSGPGWTCNTTAGTCTASSIPASATSTVSIELRLGSTATLVAFTSTLTHNGTPVGSVNYNRAVSAAPPPPAVADLRMNLTHTGDFTQSRNGAYTASVTNISGTAATAGTVTVTFAPPTGLTVTALAGAGWTCDIPTRACSRTDALAALSNYPTILATVSVSPTAPPLLSMSATVSGGGDTTPANNTTADSTRIIESIYAVQITRSTITLNRATGLYTQNISVTNLGPSLLGSAIVFPELPPANVIGASRTVNQSPANSPYFELGSIPAGATIVRTVTYSASPSNTAIRFIGTEPR
ncbi:MAG: VCBS repeat-containing protein [Bryobacterales bacterium]|nr:VCBS repeat-containing protein [Bryobacterales bacterium]